MTRRPRAYLALFPPTMPPSVARDVLARSTWALYPPALVGGGALGVVAATSDDAASVFVGAAVRQGQQPAVDRATADLRALLRDHGLPR